MSPGGGKRLDASKERRCAPSSSISWWKADLHTDIGTEILEPVLFPPPLPHVSMKLWKIFFDPPFFLSLRSQFLTRLKILPTCYLLEKRLIRNEAGFVSNVTSHIFSLFLFLCLARLLLYSTCRGIHRDRESAISQTSDQGCPVSSSPLNALKNHILSYIQRDWIYSVGLSKVFRGMILVNRESSVMQETSFSTFRVSEKKEIWKNLRRETEKEGKKEIEKGGNIL